MYISAYSGQSKVLTSIQYDVCFYGSMQQLALNLQIFFKKTSFLFFLIQSCFKMLLSASLSAVKL